MPSVTLHRSLRAPGSHGCILTRSWSRRSLCLVLSEARVPGIYCPGVADPSPAASPGSQSSWLSPYLGHSSPAASPCFTLPCLSPTYSSVTTPSRSRPAFVHASNTLPPGVPYRGSPRLRSRPIPSSRRVTDSRSQIGCGETPGKHLTGLRTGSPAYRPPPCHSLHHIPENHSLTA